MNKIERLIHLTYEFASTNLDYGGSFPMCAIITRRNKPIAIGFNKRKTHPQILNIRRGFMHAEFHAINQMRYEDLSKCTIFIARYRKTGVGLAKPCSHCEELITSVGIQRIVYTLDSTKDFLRYYTILKR